MSYLAALWGQINARAIADTGTGGLFNAGTPLVTAIYNNTMPEGSTFPYLVYDTLAATPRDAFRTSMFRVVWRVNVYVEKNSTTITDTAARGSAIIARLLGDWTAQNYGVAPTYGYDRWTPDLSSAGWSATASRSIGSGEAHEDFLWHWYEEFETFVSKNAP